MALIKCPDCGKMFSDRAEKCPVCGCTTEHAKEYEQQKAEEEKERCRKEEEERLRKTEEKRVARKAYMEKNKGKIITCVVLALLCISGITYWVVDSHRCAVAHAEMLIENALDSFQNLQEGKCPFIYRDSKFKKIFYGGGEWEGGEGMLMVYEPVLNEYGDIMEQIDTLYEDYYVETENFIECPDSLHILFITMSIGNRASIELWKINREDNQFEIVAGEVYGWIWLEGDKILSYESKILNEDAFTYEWIKNYRKKHYDLNGDIIYEETEWHNYDEIADELEQHSNGNR